MTPDALAAAIRSDLAAALAPPAPAHPWCAGAVVLAGRHDEVLLHEAAGHALRYAGWDEAAGAAVELPPRRRIPARPGTVFDLASLTKLFTAIVALQAVERGTIELDAAVASSMEEFAAAGKERVTVRHLLTHTSGLPAELPLYDCPSPAAMRHLLLSRPLSFPPGTACRYSDPGMIAVQWLLERVTGTPLETLVADGITGPLGMTGTGFRPAGPPERLAATEDERRPWARLDRGPLHGVVHDENAHALGGVAGHAGLFAPAADLGLLCRALLAGGGPVLRPGTVAEMVRDQGLPGGRGLGPEIGRPEFMGELAGPRTAGHTGFTGTSLVADFDSGAWVVLLANSVHPVRTRRSGHGPRPAVATRLARYVRGE